MEKTLNNYKCPICKIKNNKVVHEKTRAGYQVNQCRSCNLIFRVPLPSKDKIKTFYQDGYVEFLLTGLGKDGRRFKTDIETTIREKEGFLEKINFRKLALQFPNKRMFEIGPGVGDFLAICEKMGFNIDGSDLSKECVEYIQKTYGYKVRLGYFEDLDLPNNTYSLVAMWSVIEHLIDPTAVLKKVFEMLKPNGILIIATPNIDSLRHFITGSSWKGFTRGHLVFFSQKTLVSVLEKAGLKDIKVYYKPMVFFSIKAMSKRNLRSKIVLFTKGILKYILYSTGLAKSDKLYVVAKK